MTSTRNLPKAPTVRYAKFPLREREVLPKSLSSALWPVHRLGLLLRTLACHQGIVRLASRDKLLVRA